MASSLDAKAMIDAINAQTNWRQKSNQDLNDFLIQIDTALGACTDEIGQSSAALSALREKRQIVERHLALLNLLNALQSTGGNLTALESAIDSYEDENPEDLRKKLNELLGSLLNTQIATEHHAVGNHMVPEEIAHALGTFKPGGDSEGVADSSNPELYVHKQLLKLDKVAAQKDSQRVRANDMRTALLRQQQQQQQQQQSEAR